MSLALNVVRPSPSLAPLILPTTAPLSPPPHTHTGPSPTGIPCANSTGTPDNAFAWVAKHQSGAMYTWDSYPYVDGGCVFWDPARECKKNGTLTTGKAVTGLHHTIVANETDLMLAVAQQPVSIAVFSSLGTFTTYKGGVFYDKGCEDVTADMLDHAVLLVGYGTDAGVDYWCVLFGGASGAKRV